MTSTKLVCVMCPLCNKPAKQTDTQYGIRHDCCGLHSWGYSPLEDQATHALRIQAHNIFDSIWKSGVMSRSKAYRTLAETLNISSTKCHIKLMDTALLTQVPLAVDQILLKIGKAKV